MGYYEYFRITYENSFSYYLTIYPIIIYVMLVFKT